MDLPGGERLGIVDVPGHEKFVKHMVAGATGIDLVALVIAADEGIMPQTREHMESVNCCGLKKACRPHQNRPGGRSGLDGDVRDDIVGVFEGTFS